MEKQEYNRLDNPPLAELTKDEINEIQRTEQELNNKYILIAYRKM